jgi:hypothetical protein
MGLTFYDLATLPFQYDLVWCRYPQRENLFVPGPWIRPCLVLDVLADWESARAALVVAYGTGIFDRAKHKTDLIIDDWKELRSLGLHKPTRFALSHSARMKLPWCAEYFESQPYMAKTNIILGSLTEKQIERLIACLRKQYKKFSD